MKNIFLTLLAMVTAMVGCGSAQNFVSVDADDFAKAIAEKGVQLVDSRTAEEYQAGHIPGAINVDVNSADFDKKISTLKKNSVVAVYCRSGRRSKIAAKRISQQGFKVVELDGGILSWRGKIEK